MLRAVAVTDATVNDTRQVAVQRYAIVAMAFHRLNEPAEAHASLTKARKLATAKVPSLDDGDIGAFGTDWHNALIGQLLLREAKALLGEK